MVWDADMRHQISIRLLFVYYILYIFACGGQNSLAPPTGYPVRSTAQKCGNVARYTPQWCLISHTTRSIFSIYHADWSWHCPPTGIWRSVVGVYFKCVFGRFTAACLCNTALLSVTPIKKEPCGSFGCYVTPITMRYACPQIISFSYI